MKRLSLIVAFIMLFGAGAHSQSAKLKYTAIINAGLLHGASEPGWQVQVLNGARYKTFSAAFGAGIDTYYYKTATLFIDIRKDIFERKQTPFVYADFGTSMPFDRHTSESWQTSEYNKGGFYDLGVGYTWGMKKNIDFILAVGYSQKYLHVTHNYFWRTENNIEYVDYTLRRISLKTGLRF